MMQAHGDYGGQSNSQVGDEIGSRTGSERMKKFIIGECVRESSY